MNAYRPFVASLLASALAASLAACAGTPDAAESNPAPRPQATSAPLATVARPTAAAPLEIELGVSGTGVVMANQDADLVFTVQGTVEQVLVEEGDVVTREQVLAVLDTRLFDQQIQQAEAALANARAQEAALTEAPRGFDARSARAQVQQAQAAIAQLNAGPKEQDVQSLQAGLAGAQTNVQTTRDRLSLAKTQAESQMKQLTDALTQAQARYAQAKTNWEYVRDTGNDPIVPSTRDQTGEENDNEASDGSQANYYAQFVQAEAGMRQAEKAVELAVDAFDTARQAEITGIETAEQQVVQAQAALEKIKLPADQDRLAAAQASLAVALANQARLTAPPRESQKAQAAAGIAQAEASLELAKINREHTELRAPFEGIVDSVGIDPGDPSTVVGQPAIRVVDVSKLHVDAQISDIDIGKIKLNQQINVVADALPGKPVAGKVSYIAPTATVVGNIRTYLVRVTLADPAGLRVGMSVRVELAQK